MTRDELFVHMRDTHGMRFLTMRGWGDLVKDHDWDHSAGLQIEQEDGLGSLAALDHEHDALGYPRPLSDLEKWDRKYVTGYEA